MEIKAVSNVIFSIVRKLDDSQMNLVEHFFKVFLNNGKKSTVDFFAQHMHNVNIYHQKVWEISYLMVYLVAL